MNPLLTSLLLMAHSMRDDDRAESSVAMMVSILIVTLLVGIVASFVATALLDVNLSAPVKVLIGLLPLVFVLQPVIKGLKSVGK